MKVTNVEADKQYAKSETNSIIIDVQVERSSSFKSQEEDVKMEIHEVIEEGQTDDAQGSHQLIQVKDDDVSEEEEMEENQEEVESSESWSSDIDSSTDWKSIIFYGAILMFIIVLGVMVMKMVWTNDKKDVAGSSPKFEEKKPIVEEKNPVAEIPENQNVVAAEEKKRIEDEKIRAAATEEKKRIEDEKIRAATEEKKHIEDEKIRAAAEEKKLFENSYETILAAAKEKDEQDKKPKNEKIVEYTCVCITILFLLGLCILATHVAAFVANFTSTRRQPVIIASMSLAAIDAIWWFCKAIPILFNKHTCFWGILKLGWHVFIAYLSIDSAVQENRYWSYRLEGWWAPAFISGYAGFIRPIYDMIF